MAGPRPQPRGPQRRCSAAEPGCRGEGTARGLESSVRAGSHNSERSFTAAPAPTTRIATMRKKFHTVPLKPRLTSPPR